LIPAACIVAVIVAVWFAKTPYTAGTYSSQHRSLVAVPDGWADETSCVDCHEQAEEFSLTGHAQTLRPASHPDSLKLLRSLSGSKTAAAEGTSINTDGAQPVAVNRVNGLQRELMLDWCFGSGTHACTWVSTIPDSHGNTDSLEFRYTWFSSLDGFGITPGQPKNRGESAVSAMGLLFDAPKARRCFSCHATQLPSSEGRIHESAIHAGVTCQRCHGPRGTHVASEGAIHPSGWTAIDRQDAVRRCAVCHRLAEEHGTDEVVAGNPDIVRFQPVGLQRSACFLNSEMSCTTCHDPHLPMSRQDSGGIWQCIQCHDPDQQTHVTCAADMPDNCLKCHMPAVDVGFPVRFTDHWIRIPDYFSTTE